MEIRTSRLIAGLERLVDYFVPPQIAADRDARRRAHMFLVSHILGPFIGNVVPIAVYFSVPDAGLDVAILFASITAFWAFPFALKMGAPYNPLALVSIQNLIFCILWSCYFYGGVTSPTLPWVLTIPLLAFFYIGSDARLRLIVMAMFAANLVVFWLFYTSGYGITHREPTAAMQVLGLISTVAASIYVAMMALYYAKVLASQTELEAEMREHMTTAAELRRATEEAERASIAKAAFLAKMSHELRTPLNAVIGYSQILLEDAEQAANHQDIADLDKIHGAGRHLLELVDEILDISKIEAGKMQLHLDDVELAGLLADIAQDGLRAAERNGNAMSWVIEPGLGTARCDASRVRSVIGRLLANAAKYTHGGNIRLVARRICLPAADQLEVQVIDTGIGIAPERLAGLFETFRVADDGSSNQSGGVGLGLALSQRLCKLMGGDILVESEPGRGSCFTVRMPLLDISAQEMAKDMADESLVVDDRAVTLVPEAPAEGFAPARGVVPAAAS
jgi:signal transduction histidine kinase